MTRRAAVVVLALVLAALVTVGLLAAPGSPLQKDLTLGLDLQGGLEVTLQAVPPKDRELTSEDLDRSVEIMRSRVDRLGVAEPEIRTQGDDQIAIQLPGVKDPAAAAAIIGKTAQLELFDLETSLTGPSIDATGNPVAIGRLYDLLARVQALAAEGTSEEWYVFNAKKRLVEGPATSREEALRRWKGKVPKGFKVFAAPEGTVVIRCNTTAAICPGTAPRRQRLVPLQVRATRGAADDRCRPEALGHPRRLRHEPDGRRPADRVDGVHRQGGGQVPGDHA